ncbi:MAG TPA: oligosaccharide flippase family protein [Polyangia bacterium]
MPSTEHSEAAEPAHAQAQAEAHDRRLGDKAGVVVASKVVIALATVGMVLAIPRLLPKEEVGVLNFLLMLYEIVAGVGVFGIPNGLLYFMPQLSPPRRKAFVRLTTLLLLGLGLAGAGVLMGLGDLIIGSFRPSPHRYLPLIALYIVLDLPTLALPNLLISVDRAPLAARLNMVSVLIQVGGLLTPLWLHLPLTTVLLIFCASAAVRLALYLAVSAWLHAGVAAAGLREHVQPLLRFAVPLGFSSAMGLLNQQIDKYLIAMSFAAAAFADYAMGARELPIVSVLPYTVATVLMPTFVEHWLGQRPAELLRVWHGSILKVGLVMMPLCVVFFVAAEAYVTLLFTGGYIRAAGPMRIYLLLLPLRVTSYGVILQSLGDTRTVLEAATLGVVLNALGSIAGIAFLGFLGPSVAAVAVQFFVTFWMLMRIRQRLGISVRALFPWAAYLRVIAVALACAPVAWLIVRLCSFSAGLALGASFAGYAAAYVTVGSLCGIISAADRAWLVEKLRFWRRAPAA